MTEKNLLEAFAIPTFDSLNLFHHSQHEFEQKLQTLLLILEEEKESNLTQRFNDIEKILDSNFCYELFHFLQPLVLKAAQNAYLNNKIEHTQLLLRLLCFLTCTNSTRFIAQYLALTEEETEELMEELDNTFIIDSLLTFLRQFFAAHKHKKVISSPEEEDELLEKVHSSDAEELDEGEQRRLKNQADLLAIELFDWSHTKF